MHFGEMAISKFLLETRLIFTIGSIVYNAHGFFFVSLSLFRIVVYIVMFIVCIL